MNAGFDSHSPDSAQDSHISCSTAAQAAAPKRSHALLMRKGPGSAGARFDVSHSAFTHGGHSHGRGQGGRVSNPTTQATPLCTLHPSRKSHSSSPSSKTDCTQGLTLSHLLHLRQTTTSHTSSCQSHRITHAERVEHRRACRRGKPWMEIHRYRISRLAPRSPRINLATGPPRAPSPPLPYPAAATNAPCLSTATPGAACHSNRTARGVPEPL
jgi:hypothetical protein